MSKNIDINSPEWCNIVFEGKNKDYGAYVMRKLSRRRHIRSLVIVLVIFLLALLLPKFIVSVIPEKKEAMVEVTSLADLKIEEPQPKEEIHIEAPPPPLKSTIKFTPPVIQPDEEVSEEDLLKTQESLNEEEIAISIADVVGTDEENGMDIADLDVNKAITGEDNDSLFIMVEEMPKFPGGEAALRQWINNQLKYPLAAVEKGIQGKVYVQFIVDKDGKTSGAKVIQGVDPSLDQEALRVINRLPLWNPGKQRGTPVKVAYTVPINFVLD